MKRTTLSGLLFVAGLSLAGAVLAQTNATLQSQAGFWVEMRGPGSAGLHQSLELLEDGRFRLTLFPQRSFSNRLVVEGRCDGKPYPHMQGGKPAASTFSCRIAGPRTMEYVYTHTGESSWKTSTGTQTVSEDGQLLSIDAVHRDADGKFIEELHRRLARSTTP